MALNPGPKTLLASVNKHTGNSGLNGYNTFSGSQRYFFMSSNAAVCCSVQNSGVLNALINAYNGAALRWCSGWYLASAFANPRNWHNSFLFLGIGIACNAFMFFGSR